jgi:hypothetical protein
MSLVNKLASEGHLSAEQVDRIGRHVREFMREVDSNPSFMKEAVEKLSGWDSAVKKLSPDSGFLQHAYANAHDALPYLLASAGLGAGLGMGADLGKRAIHGVQDSVQKNRAYKAMMSENPNLAETDPGMAEKAFNTLYRFNPEYARDPLVAGSFVKNVMDQERLDLNSMNNLVSAHRQMSDSNKGKGSTEFFMNAMPSPDLGMKLDKSRYEANKSMNEADKSEIELQKARQP